MRTLVVLMLVLGAGVITAQDLSDAPSPYPQFTIFYPGGGTRLDYLGSSSTDDTTHGNGWQDDDADDGIEFLNMVKGGTATIKVAVVCTGTTSDLAIWMDFNDNGTWEASERVIWAGHSSAATHGPFSARVAPPYGGSSTSFNTYSVPIPAGAQGSSVKVRAILWDTTSHATGPMAANGGGHPGGATGLGFSDYGEVEDHDIPYGTSTGAKFRLFESDGWSLGSSISHNGTYNVGNLTAGSQHSVFFVMGNDRAASYFTHFTTAWPNPTISISNMVNCTVQQFAPGNGVTILPGDLFTGIAFVTPTSSAPFSYQLHIPTNDPLVPTFTFTCQGNGTAPAPKIEIHRPTYTVLPNGTTQQHGDRDAGTPFDLHYTIFNNGQLQLDFTGNPIVAVSNLVNCNVNVTQPAQNYLPSGGWSYGVPMQVTPTAAGSAFSFTFSVASNDTANPSYVIHGTGNAVVSGGSGGGGGGGGGGGSGGGGGTGTPELRLERNSVAITSGSGSNLGSSLVGGTTVYHFAAANIGTGPLTFTGNPRIAISNENNCSVLVPQQLPAGIAAGATAPFAISVTTAATGNISFTLTVLSDDPATPAYTVHVQGTAGDGTPTLTFSPGAGRSGGGGCVAGTGGTALLALLALATFALVRRRSSAKPVL